MSRLASIATTALCSALVLGTRGTPPARAEPHAQEARATTPPPDAIVGEWWTEGNEGRIRFVRSPDGTYSGLLVGGKDPGADVNNKDPALRKRSLLGTVLIWHLRPDDGEYVDGYVYNPRKRRDLSHEGGGDREDHTQDPRVSRHLAPRPRARPGRVLPSLDSQA
jgi:hypothetical protein